MADKQVTPDYFDYTDDDHSLDDWDLFLEEEDFFDSFSADWEEENNRILDSIFDKYEKEEKEKFYG